MLKPFHTCRLRRHAVTFLLAVGAALSASCVNGNQDLICPLTVSVGGASGDQGDETPGHSLGRCMDIPESDDLTGDA